MCKLLRYDTNIEGSHCGMIFSNNETIKYVSRPTVMILI